MYPISTCYVAHILLRHIITNAYTIYDVKVKEISIQAWTGPEGSRKLRIPDFKTIGV